MLDAYSGEQVTERRRSAVPLWWLLVPVALFVLLGPCGLAEPLVGWVRWFLWLLYHPPM